MMVSSSPLQALLTCSLPLLVAGWGTLGHEMVANIAWHRINDGTKAWIEDILGPQNNTEEAGSPLAAVADWADRVRYFKPWSGPLHYIDVRDDLYDGGCHYDSNNSSSSSSSSPSGACSFDYERDCPNDICVAGAILNYTSQLIEKAPSKKSSSSLRRSEPDDSWKESQALRFVTQYVLTRTKKRNIVVTGNWKMRRLTFLCVCVSLFASSSPPLKNNYTQLYRRHSPAVALFTHH
jgi:hypothetical protein